MEQIIRNIFEGKVRLFMEEDGESLLQSPMGLAAIDVGYRHVRENSGGCHFSDLSVPVHYPETVSLLDSITLPPIKDYKVILLIYFEDSTAEGWNR